VIDSHIAENWDDFVLGETGSQTNRVESRVGTGTGVGLGAGVGAGFGAAVEAEVGAGVIRSAVADVKGAHFLVTSLHILKGMFPQFHNQSKHHLLCRVRQ
jgi:hypothetical protein